jgi:hypothetical protein
MRLSSALLFLCVVFWTAGQTPSFNRASRADADALAARMQTSGTKLERSRVVAYFEPGLIPQAEQEQWADLMSKGIDDIEKLLKVSLGAAKLEYYVASPVTETSFSLGTRGQTVLRHEPFADEVPGRRQRPRHVRSSDPAAPAPPAGI